MSTITLTQKAQVRDVLAESFVEELDGFWYPVEPGAPLVRVYLSGGGYMIERRRTPQVAWSPIVTAALAEFSPESFRDWRARYPMATG